MGTYIYTTPSKTDDWVVLDNPVADISIGADNTFQIQTPTEVKPRSLMWIPDTPFGGIVDEVEKDSDSMDYTLKGRTWPGVLSDCVVIPPDGKTNLTVSGTLNDCVFQILLASGWPFGTSFRTDDDTKQLSNITIDRFVTAKDAIDKIMSLADGGGYEIAIDSYQSDANPFLTSYWASTVDIPAVGDIHITRTKTTPAVNHLIGLGSGEGTAREICHRYIGADGEITSTKYYTGADERTATYDINNDSGDKLIADTEKKLKEYVKPDTVELKMPDRLGLDIHIGSHIRVISDYLNSFTATVTGGVFKLDATGTSTVTWTAEI